MFRSRPLRKGNNQPVEARRRAAHCRAPGIRVACRPGRHRIVEPERDHPGPSARRWQSVRRRWLPRQLSPPTVVRSSSVRVAWCLSLDGWTRVQFQNCNPANACRHCRHQSMVTVSWNVLRCNSVGQSLKAKSLTAIGVRRRRRGSRRRSRRHRRAERPRLHRDKIRQPGVRR
jgi:hypothetical protein